MEPVVQATQAPPSADAEHLPRSSTSARWVAAGSAVVVGIGLGLLGTALVAPGQSLAVPTAIVAAVGGGVVLVAWVVASFRASRQAGWVFAVGVAAVTVMACIWTFEFTLPAAIEWSNATAQAQDTFNRLQHAVGKQPWHSAAAALYRPRQRFDWSASGALQGMRRLDARGTCPDVRLQRSGHDWRSRLHRPTVGVLRRRM